ncbi:MAG TPA: Tim44-like domain-containing protein [Burkholderiaceae bacterium]|nr:Tim44-like domain-containing protein [Burkholderiaceae bacterium]
MKQFLWTLVMAVGLAFALAPADAEAKRLGGGKSSGMQRSAPDKAQPNTPAQPAAAPNTPAAPGAAAAAAPKRSWMGPIAGLAAGLGLAALFSHLGMGEGLANFVMIALLALAAFFVIRLLMRRFMGGGAQPPLAMAGAAAGARPVAAPPPRFVDERPGMQREAAPAPTVTIGSALAPVAAGTAVPAGFDTEGFERLAKMLFIRMQAANDTADLNDLRSFTTPELFASLRLDLQDRGDAKQTTDVVKVDARLIDFAQEAERQIVSVRFTGLIREDADAAATPFDEVWHLVKPQDDSRSWAIAGIQQAQ